MPFGWLLDLRHGADYFRRWHREKVNFGGLMVLKAAGARRCLVCDYTRAHSSPAVAGDPFAVRVAKSPSSLAQLLPDPLCDTVSPYFPGNAGSAIHSLRKSSDSLPPGGGFLVFAGREALAPAAAT